MAGLNSLLTENGILHRVWSKHFLYGLVYIAKEVSYLTLTISAPEAPDSAMAFAMVTASSSATAGSLQLPMACLMAAAISAGLAPASAMVRATVSASSNMSLNVDKMEILRWMDWKKISHNSKPDYQAQESFSTNYSSKVYRLSTGFGQTGYFGNILTEITENFRDKWF